MRSKKIDNIKTSYLSFFDITTICDNFTHYKVQVPLISPI